MVCPDVALSVGKKKGSRAAQEQRREHAGSHASTRASQESRRGWVTGIAFGAKARSRKVSKSSGALASSQQALGGIRSNRRRPLRKNDGINKG